MIGNWYSWRIVLKRYWKILLTLVIASAVINIIGFSKGFCTWYADNVYPFLNCILGTLTSWCPFAIGEIIMYAGALLIIVLLVSVILFAFLFKKKWYKKYMSIYYRTCLMIVVLFLFSYSFVWFIPFRATPLQVSDNTRVVYSLDEVLAVRNMIVDNINQAALEAPRDENGHVIYDYTEKDIADVMRARSSDYKRLKWFYPNMKPALCSDFLHWMSIGGYNYIYTMEPTYNIYCDELYMPILKSHELCHNKGYYLENEAEFLSSVILAESDNVLFKYSAYIEMYGYVHSAYISDLHDSLIEAGCEPGQPVINAIKEVLADSPKLDPIVYADMEYAREQADKLYEENVDKEKEASFQQVSSEVADKGWEIQGEVLGENTYSGVTLMLLQYYIEE